MFGYVIADLGRLTEAQRLRYHSVYCGLCRALYADYGAAGALALTYDMTFLALLLAALYEPEERKRRCALPAPPGPGAAVGGLGIHRLRGGHELPARLGKLPGRLGGREKALRRRGRGNARAGCEEGRGAVPGEGGGHPPRARADRAGGSRPGGLFRDPGQRLRGPDGGAVLRCGTTGGPTGCGALRAASAS